jgi:FG-GAP-like repeat
VSAVQGAAPTNIQWAPHFLFADLNGDGGDDLVLPGFFGVGEPLPWQPRIGYVALSSPTGLRTADPAVFPIDSLRSVHPREFAVADFNGDGFNDFFVADHGYDAPPFPGYQNQLFLSSATATGTPKWTDATPALPQVLDFTHSVAVGDVNGDGKTDIFVGNGGLPDTSFLINDGNGGFTPNTQLLPINPGQPYNTTNIGFTSSHIVDLDGDGKPELVLGSSYPFRATQVLWNEAGTFAGGAFTALPEPAGFGQDWTILDVQSVDLNGDGLQDLVLSYQAHVLNGGWRVQFLINRGNRRFTDETATYLPFPNVVSSGIPSSQITWIDAIKPIDLNGDGRIDFVMVCHPNLTFAEHCPIALIQQPDRSFAPVTVGMLLAAGVPQYIVSRPRLIAGRAGLEIVTLVRGSNGSVEVHGVPVTFGR